MFLSAGEAVLSNYPPANKISSIRKLNKIGMLYYKKNVPVIALSYFKRIVKLQPLNQKALYNCACMNALLGKIRETVFYLLNLFNVNPSWIKKLKPGAEKDFQYIKNHPIFRLYKMYWLEGTHPRYDVYPYFYIKHFAGTYDSIRLFFNRDSTVNRFYTLKIKIKKSRLNRRSFTNIVFTVDANNEIGRIFHGYAAKKGSVPKIYSLSGKPSKPGNVFLLELEQNFDSNEDTTRMYLVEIVQLTKKALQIRFAFYKKKTFAKRIFRVPPCNAGEMGCLAAQTFVRR